MRLIDNSNPYSSKKYLHIVRSPYVRGIVTRLRIDANKLNECRFRHYRKKASTSVCTHCGTQETVEHRLLSCTKGGLADLRESLMVHLRLYIPQSRLRDSNDILSVILNVRPICKNEENRTLLIDKICTFIKKMYEVD